MWRIIAAWDWIVLLGALLVLTISPLLTGKLLAACDKSPKPRYDTDEQS